MQEGCCRKAAAGELMKLVECARMVQPLERGTWVQLAWEPSAGVLRHQCIGFLCLRASALHASRR